MKFTGFDSFGNEVTRGYAQLHLPYDSGQKIVEAYIYEVIRE